MTAFPGLEAADRVLLDGVRDGLWPGLVAAIGADDVEHRWVLGRAEDWTGGQRPMTADTVFDLASLTKVVATLPAVLLLVQRGLLGLEDPVNEHVPGVDPRVRIRHLLTHTSGLPAHRSLYERVTGPDELIRAAAEEPLENPPDTTVAYSDLGFILLGGVVRAVTGHDLPEFAREEVFAPLGVHATFVPPASWLPRTAATEIVDGAPVLGRVHDENAAAGGGRAGHAGLFGELEDLVRYLPAWRTGGPLLDLDLRAAAIHDRTDGLGGHRGLGWTCRGDGYDILSEGWGPAAVSHTGFTGTSIALDPVRGRWAVLLTNAVHYGRGRPAVFAARRAFHAALVT